MKNYLLFFSFSLILIFPFSQVEKSRVSEKEKNIKPHNVKQITNKGLKGEIKSPSNNSFNSSKTTNKTVILSNEKVLKKSNSSNKVIISPSNAIEPEANFCKGWSDGYSKVYFKIKKTRLNPSEIPNCIPSEKCKGYRCGYEAGMKKAELILR